MFLLKYALLVFLFIFNFTIGPLGITSAELAGLLVMLAAVMSRSCREAILKYLVQTRYLHLSLFILGIYGVLLSSLWGPSELIFGLIFVKLFISSIIAFSIIFFFRKDLQHRASITERDVIYSLFDVFFAACFLQASTVILSFLYPEIREVFNGIVAKRGNIDVDHPFRLRGLHDSGGFNLSVTLGIASVYGIYSGVVLGRRGFALRVVSSIFIVIALTLVGRTGLMVGIAGFVFLIFFRIQEFFRSKFIFSIVGFMLSVLALNAIFPERFEFFNSVIFDYAFELFVNYEKGEGLATESSDDLLTMLFIPDVLHLFFGNGSFDEVSLGVERSDSGYMKILLASGLFGFIYFYAHLFFLVLWMARNIVSTGIEWMFFIFLILVFLVCEVKGPVFVQNDTSRFFLLVVMIFFTIKKDGHTTSSCAKLS